MNVNTRVAKFTVRKELARKCGMVEGANGVGAQRIELAAVFWFHDWLL